MKKKNKQVIIIFAREPRLGKVKTRLSKDLGQEKTLELYKAFLTDVLAKVKNIKNTDYFIYYHGRGGAIPFLSQYKKGFHLKRQMGLDLGQRMKKAVVHCFNSGYEKVVIIGSDCVSLKLQDFKRAFSSLNTCDVVLGPACDGGYYLIGLKTPIISVFDRVSWSSVKVLEQTIKKVKDLRKRFFLLPMREDIDTIEALIALKKVKFNKVDAPATFRVLQDL